MPVKLKFTVTLVYLILALAACQVYRDVTSTPHPPPSATLAPTATSLPSPIPLLSPIPTPEPSLLMPTPFVPEFTLEVVGQIGGYAQAVAVQYSIAYLAVGPQVLVVDVSDPAAPRQIRQTGILNDRVADVVVMDGLLFIAAGQAGLHILDITDPVNPYEVGFMPSEFSARQVILHGSVALVAESRSRFEDHSDILRLIDVTDPTMPREITRLEGQVLNVEGDNVYINQDDVLKVIDVSNPYAPHMVADTGLPNVWSVINGYAYTVDRRSGTESVTSTLGLVDVSIPDDPQERGSLELIHDYLKHVGHIVPVDDSFICAITLFIGESAFTVSTLDFIDVSNPGEPQLVASWMLEGDLSWRTGMVADEILVDGMLYLAVSDTYANNGLWVVDVNAPSNPRMTGSFHILSSAHSVVGIGEYAYVTSGYFPDYLNLVDATDLSNVQDRGVIHSAHWGEMELANNYLYVPGGASSDGVPIFDVTDPANPRLLDRTVSDFGGFIYLSIADDLVCVSGNSRLRLFDVSEPAAPRQISQLDAEGIHQVVCTENFAYYVHTRYDDQFSTISTLHVVDISILTSPQEIGVIDLPPYVHDIVVAGEHLYMLADCGIDCPKAELVVIDVSDGAHPHQVASLKDTLDDFAYTLSLVGHYLYVADGDVWILDISDPTNPRPVGYLDTPGYARDVSVMDNSLFVADEGSGVTIIRIQDQSSKQNR